MQVRVGGPLTSVLVPHLGVSMKLGRLRPLNRLRLHARDYLRHAQLPPPPPSVDWSPSATSALAQVYLNDQLGDCVIAGLMHLVGVWTGNASGGAPFIATPDQVVAAYSAIGGYVPGQASTDQGCDEQVALNYAQQVGLADGTKFAGSFAVDATNQLECQQVISLFEGGVMFGVALPDAWISPFPSAAGFTWDVAGPPNPSNGHCVVGVGYTAAGILISTWGLVGTMTWAAVAKYAVQASGGELYAALSPDQVAKGQAAAPNGLAWADLQADFDALAARQPLPPPQPAPGPATVTLEQAQMWAAQGLADSWPT
ncbi:MAG TPA: hypothetical protein VES97_02155 [Solirubrobacteraceae bacterium]|nr:hypothetical protein [Solirubrobacteraceae bacterium]